MTPSHSSLPSLANGTSPFAQWLSFPA
ncbi:unnamed protein product [Chondrus crispus]|uniref:Uncharacterized protein n=1 Tax=Chondrus crispus TaxID=2769 RepID=R7Q6A6_CHOCR|nr:unnamed protein product [Chondrus crispus]CDF32926.1 unnamed protein product [Chondrus crispus]|eukprot:XP_005712729.1 unnamed protein product [Chondrus crispus]